MTIIQDPMNIGVIGGGRRCKALLEMLEARRLPRFNIHVLAVADRDIDAEGMKLARRNGIFTTRDPEDFRKIPGMECVLELTGDPAVLDSFRSDAPARVRDLESALSRLMTDMIRFRGEYLVEKRVLDLNESIVESIFSSIHDEVMLLRPDLKIMDANDAVLKSLGCSKEELIGRHCFEAIRGAASACEDKGEICPVIESLETGSGAHGIREHLPGEACAGFREITSMPLKNSAGEIELALVIMRDITAELERRVEQRTRKFKMNLSRLIHDDKMIALGKLVSSAVHEINNPLTGILGLARLMHQRLGEEQLTEYDFEQFKYYLQLIDTEAARCSGIVGNLLSFSRQQKIESRSLQLNEITRKVILLFQYKAGQHQIEIREELDPDLPEIVGDPGQIQQCLINLLFNSMEALPDGGVITMKSYLDRERGSINLEVEDNGVGIPEELVSKVFEPFFSTKLGEKGVGLGLSVVYGIIKSHRGSIYINTEVGKGTTFIIRFPVNQPASKKRARAQ